MAREGHVWHNFFWARSSHVKRVVEPIVSADRYYYEGWLGKLKPYDEKTKEPSELQPTAAGPDEEQEFYQTDAKDGLTLCGNNVDSGGVMYTLPYTQPRPHRVERVQRVPRVGSGDEGERGQGGVHSTTHSFITFELNEFNEFLNE